MNSNQYDQQEYQAPVSLASLVKIPMMKKVKKLGARQELVNQVCFELGIADHYRSGIFWNTKLLTDSEIKKIKDECLAFRANPAALFNIKIKEKRKQILAKLHEQNA